MLNDVFTIRGILFVTITLTVILVTFKKPYIGLIYLVILEYYGAILRTEVTGLFQGLHVPLVMGVITLFCWFLTKSRGENNIPSSSEVWFLFGLFLTASVSSIVAGSGFLSNPTIDRFFKLLIISFLIIALINTEEKLTQLIWALIVVNVLLAYTSYNNYYYGSYEFAIPVPIKYGQTDYAQDFITALPFAYIFFWREKKLYRKFLLVICLFYLILSIVYSGSRASNIALMFTMGLLFLNDMRSNGSSKRLVLIIPVGILLLITHPQAISSRLKPLTEIKEDTSASLRVYQFNASLNALAAHPILGVGPGNFSSQYLNYVSPQDRAEAPWLPEKKSIHGMVSQVISETGLLGLFFFSALYLAVFLSIIKVRRICNREKKEKLGQIIIGLAIGLIAVSFRGLVVPAGFAGHVYLIIAMIVATKHIVLKEVYD